MTKPCVPLNTLNEHQLFNTATSNNITIANTTTTQNHHQINHSLTHHHHHHHHPNNNCCNNYNINHPLQSTATTTAATTTTTTTNPINNMTLTSRVSKRRRNRDTPPRPLNSFMIYRREYQKKIKEQNPNILLSELSRISKSAADKWANEPQNIKQLYAEKARAEKEQHMKLYPNYVYCPRRPTKTKPRKKSTEGVGGNVVGMSVNGVGGMGIGGVSEKMSVSFLLNDDNSNFNSYNSSLLSPPPPPPSFRQYNHSFTTSS